MTSLLPALLTCASLGCSKSDAPGPADGPMIAATPEKANKPSAEQMAAATISGDTVRFAINPGRPGKQGHREAANAAAMSTWSMTQPVVMDPAGQVGRIYGAERRRSSS